MRRIKSAALTRNVSKTIDGVVESGAAVIITRRGADLVAIVPLVVKLGDEDVARMVAAAREAAGS